MKIAERLHALSQSSGASPDESCTEHVDLPHQINPQDGAADWGISPVRAEENSSNDKETRDSSVTERESLDSLLGVPGVSRLTGIPDRHHPNEPGGPGRILSNPDQNYYSPTPLLPSPAVPNTCFTPPTPRPRTEQAEKFEASPIPIPSRIEEMESPGQDDTPPILITLNLTLTLVIQAFLPASAVSGVQGSWRVWSCRRIFSGWSLMTTVVSLSGDPRRNDSPSAPGPIAKRGAPGAPATGLPPWPASRRCEGRAV